MLYLFQQHHLPGLDEFTSDNPVKIDSTSNGDSEFIPAVPYLLVKTCLTVLFVPSHYLLSHQIIYYERKVRLLWQSITDRGLRVERIWVVIRQTVNLWNQTLIHYSNNIFDLNNYCNSIGISGSIYYNKINVSYPGILTIRVYECTVCVCIHAEYSLITSASQLSI